jgi:hypothetical protein
VLTLDRTRPDPLATIEVSHAVLVLPIANPPTTSTTNTLRMAPPPLPQELIDKIIDQFSSNKSMLASLSMVSRAWRGRSQKYLFSVINFRMPSLMGVIETDLDELGPVFSLTRELNIDVCWVSFRWLDPVTIAFTRRFRNVESLFLTNWYLGLLSSGQLSTRFRHFGETVIELEGIRANSKSLIYLIDVPPIARSPDLYRLRLR